MNELVQQARAPRERKEKIDKPLAIIQAHKDKLSEIEAIVDGLMLELNLLLPQDPIGTEAEMGDRERFASPLNVALDDVSTRLETLKGRLTFLLDNLEL